MKGFTLMVAGIMRGRGGRYNEGSEGVHSNGGRYNEGK